MKFDKALEFEAAIATLVAEFKADEVEGGATEDVVDEMIGLDVLADVLDGFLSTVKKRKEQVSRVLVDRFVDGGQESVTRRNRTVYLATEFWPSPRVDDLLPENADPDDPAYEATVVRVRDAAKDRLVQALKSSPNFADLVSEGYNAASLRSALTGKDAERDDENRPIVPPDLAGVVDLNPRVVIRVRRSGR